MHISRDHLQQMQDEIGRIFAISDAHTRQTLLDANLAKHGCANLPELRRKIGTLWKIETTLQTYNEIFERMRGAGWYVFMNHGYVPQAEETSAFPQLSEADDRWRHQAYLYFHLVNAALAASGRTTLADCELLEVGSGRGGGLSAITRYYGCRRAVGVDLNPRHIEFCAEQHRGVAVDFLQADASTLSFDDGSFDVVLNVESSHCYHDQPGFFQEVRRVLRPKGLFLLADLRDPSYGAPLLDVELLASGMTTLFRRDITESVHEACTLDAERFRRVFGSEPAGEFPVEVATGQAKRYAAGAVVYLSYVLQKPA